jgi:hypothetical protein
MILHRNDCLGIAHRLAKYFSIDGFDAIEIDDPNENPFFIVRVDFHPAGFGRACKKSILASILQNDWSKNLSTADTPPTPGRIFRALKPFTDHNLFTTRMLPKILPAFV